MEDMQPAAGKPDEIDLLELAGKIWKKRKFVIKTAIAGAIAGLIVAFSIFNEYTTTVKMAPEGMKATSESGVADLAAMAGFDLGGKNKADGINLMLYPDVVMSTPFIVEMSQIPVRGKKMESPVTLYDYIDNGLSQAWWGVVLGLPMKALGWVASIWSEKEETPDTLNPYALTRDQSRVLDMLKARMQVFVDKKTGVITASATMQDPVVTATVADSLVRKLEEYMSDYRTEKARRDMLFTQNLFDEAREKYYAAQRKYAQAADANQRIARNSAKIELDRLQNEQQLAFGVYNQLAQQLESAKIKVQEQTPCVTIIEPATVPVKKSNTSKLVILIGFIFLGGIAGISTIIFKDVFLKKKKGEEAV